MHTGVVVIGAGACGLAARSRIGGRAYTMRTPDGAFPIELGAEFVHGSSHAMTALLRESMTQTIETLSLPGVWEATQAVLDRVDVNAPDRSVDAFLKSVDMEGADLSGLVARREDVLGHARGTDRLVRGRGDRARDALR